MLQPYLLELNGKLAGRFFDFSGGTAHSHVMDIIGPDMMTVRRQLSRETSDNIVVTCGTGMSRPFYAWVGSSFEGSHARCSGAVITLNGDYHFTSRFDFQNGLISSLVLPDLDKSQQQQAFMTVSIKPEVTSFQKSDEVHSLGVYRSSLPKAWSVGNFRIKIDGLENECKFVTRIRSLRLGQQVIKGPLKGRVQPGAISLPNLVIELPGFYTSGFYQWHKNVIEGSHFVEKDGSVEFLAPNSSTPYFGLDLNGLGIVSISSPSALMKESAPSVKIEMYCENMRFRAGAAATK